VLHLLIELVYIIQGNNQDLTAVDVMEREYRDALGEENILKIVKNIHSGTVGLTFFFNKSQ
jgi:hypothetical protein